MKRLCMLTAAAGCAVLSSASLAADILMPAQPTVGPVEAPDPAFRWDRMYLGAFAGAWVEVPPPGTNYFRAGAVAGRNFTLTDRFVFGLESTVGFYDLTDPYLELYGFARGGVLATDNLFLYLSAGIGLETGLPFNPDYALMIGGGAELAVSDHVTLRADAMFWREFGDVFDYLSLTGGVSWYFGQ